MVEKFPVLRGRGREPKPVEEQRERHVVKKGFVEVHHKLFEPNTDISSKIDPSSANVFLTGWSVPEDTKALEKYGQKLADISGKPTYIIDTPFHAISGNTISYEAEAIKNFLEKKRVNKLSLSGHSRGGTKAMHVAYQIQEQDSAKVERLTLINSVGLYDQSLPDRVRRFAEDILLTHIHLYKSLHRKNGKDNFASAKDIFRDSLLNQAHDAMDERLHYLGKVLDELKPTGEINPHTHELTCPVGIITGAKDRLSDPREIIPNKQRQRKEKPWLRYEEREAYLKETLFSSSPSVKMLVAERDPHHVGIVLRPHTYAQVQEAMHRRSAEQPPKKRKNLPREDTVFSITA